MQLIVLGVCAGAKNYAGTVGPRDRSRAVTKHEPGHRNRHMRPSDLASVARFILSPECKSIAMLTGAGVSVAAGIPDFRSPGGMYDALQPDKLTATDRQRRAMAADAVAVVTRDLFFANAFPYLEVRRPFILGTHARKWRPTLSHRFAQLLHSRTGVRVKRRTLTHTF